MNTNPTAETVTPQHWGEITPEARVERWENVLRVLKAMPQHEREKHWDMGLWGDRNACGTVACAAGHCGLDPWFRARGFRLDFRKSLVIEDYWIESLNGTQVIEFFGSDGTELIFFNDCPRSVDDVIGEVEEFLGRSQEWRI